MKYIAVFLTATIWSFSASADERKGSTPQEARAETAEGTGILWKMPADISSRNLFYGPGGQEHAPKPNSTFTFVKEDLKGTNPKFVVRDEDGVKWKVKLGEETRPETVASRLVWAIGYFANDDYFLADFHAREMPAHLHRGQKLVEADGSVHNVRLKRYSKGEDKTEDWSWRNDPFAGTRELNGLRTVMALINNWDLKSENNAIYEGSKDSERIYMVSDLGASFGTAGVTWPRRKAKGNLESYSHSQFIAKLRPDYVDFHEPGAPMFFYLFANPLEYLRRCQMRWIGKHIPRADARWTGQLLAQLSPNQIRDAFRAAGYSPDVVEAFSRIVEDRIGELKGL